MSSSKSTKLLNVVPVDELKAIITTHPEVLLEVRQRVANNKFRSVVSKSVSMSPSQCYNGELETWLKQHWGGGEFEVSVWDPADPATTVAPRWRLILPGSPVLNHQQQSGTTPFGQPQQSTPYNPYAPQTPYAPSPGLPGMGQAPGQHGPQPFGAGMPGAPGMPGQSPGYPSPHMPGYPPGFVPHLPGLRPGGARRASDGGPGNGASMYSDQVAHGWAERTDGRLQSAQNENKRLQEQLIAMERQAAQQAVQGQIEALRIQMQQAQQPQRSLDWGGVLAGLGAIIGPLATAFLNSSSNRAHGETQAQIRQMELQQQNQQAMLAVAQQKPQSQLGEILPAVMPGVLGLIASMMEQKSPQAQVEANLATQQMQMAQAKMIMDFIDRESGPDGDRPWWAPMLEGMLMGGMELVEAARQGQLGSAPTIQNQAPGQPQPTQRAANARRQPQGQPQPQDGPHAYDMYPWEDLAERNSKAAMITRMIFTKIPEDAGFHTREWQVLIFNLHAETNPEQVADALVSHLESCAKLGQLPSALGRVFEEPEILREVLEHFPVYQQSREYAEEVLRIALERIDARFGDDPADMDSPTPEGPGAEAAATVDIGGVPENGAGPATPAPEATGEKEGDESAQEREPAPAAAGAQR